MSDNLNLQTPWDPSLILHVRDGGNDLLKLDFNRFRYLNVPLPRAIETYKVQSANREDLVLHLFKAFREREGAADSTLVHIFIAARQHITFSDQRGITPFTKSTVISQLQYNDTRQRLGELKDTTIVNHRASLSTLLQWLELPAKSWLMELPTPSRTQREPTRAYSNSELKQMLPLLRSIFKQLCQQFISEPERHLKAVHRVPTMNFYWKGKHYKVNAGINKLFYAATYLLSYYCWSNNSVLFQLKRPRARSRTFFIQCLTS